MRESRRSFRSSSSSPAAKKRDYFTVLFSVADPDPNVFRHPGSGSGSISQKYGSVSGSFYHQGNIVRKTLIPTVL